MPSPDLDDERAADAWLGQIMGLLSPMLLGMTTGSLVGHLSTRTFGVYDLPIPRAASDEIVVVAPNVAAFADDWSMDGNDLRLWVALHQLLHHTVLRVPHVRARLEQLLGDYVGAFESDPDALGERLADLELDGSGTDPMAQFQQLMGNPEFVLGAVRSERQERIRTDLETLAAAVAGYVDHLMDRIGTTLIGSYQQVTEALHRRRVEASPSDRFVERLFGLELTQEHFDRGRAFVDGIVDRAGDDGLRRLWSDPADLPTPNELDAPGLWLARIGVDTFDQDLEIDLSGLDELLGGDDPQV
jgi:putative hydrolase